MSCIAIFSGFPWVMLGREVKPSTSTWGAGKNRQLVPGPWTFPTERGRSHQPLGVWESQMIQLWSFYSKPASASSIYVLYMYYMCIIYITIHTHIYIYIHMLAIFHPSFFLTFQPAQTFPDPACTACRLQRSHPHGQHDFQAAWLGRKNESWDTYGYLIWGFPMSFRIFSKWDKVGWHGTFGCNAASASNFDLPALSGSSLRNEAQLSGGTWHRPFCNLCSSDLWNPIWWAMVPQMRFACWDLLVGQNREQWPDYGAILYGKSTKSTHRCCIL